MTHEFKSPKYWAELRAEKRKLQAASLKQAIQETVPWNEVVEAQASSSKPQAPSESNSKLQASSPKHKASSLKPQASSSMIREPRNI